MATVAPLLIFSRRNAAITSCFVPYRLRLKPLPSKVMSELMLGNSRRRLTSSRKVMVSAPLPAGQLPAAASLLAAVMASAKEQALPFRLTG